jgi:hypothetical protein
MFIIQITVIIALFFTRPFYFLISSDLWDIFGKSERSRTIRCHIINDKQFHNPALVYSGFATTIITNMEVTL